MGEELCFSPRGGDPEAATTAIQSMVFPEPSLGQDAGLPWVCIKE